MFTANKENISFGRITLSSKHCMESNSSRAVSVPELDPTQIAGKEAAEEIGKENGTALYLPGSRCYRNTVADLLTPRAGFFIKTGTTTKILNRMLVAKLSRQN